MRFFIVLFFGVVRGSLEVGLDNLIVDMMWFPKQPHLSNADMALRWTSLGIACFLFGRTWKAQALRNHAMRICLLAFSWDVGASDVLQAKLPDGPRHAKDSVAC